VESFDCGPGSAAAVDGKPVQLQGPGSAQGPMSHPPGFDGIVPDAHNQKIPGKLFVEDSLDGTDIHPRDLSEGQRLALALAVVLAASPTLLLLDEPTRGLDYPAKERLTAMLRCYAADGHAIIVATHDVELAADTATRTVVLADGDVVADGPTREVVTHSPAFAPQVAKVLAPLPWLTVRDVTEALAG
jgi:ABC-type taurine transport system ATPase subunit